MKLLIQHRRKLLHWSLYQICTLAVTLSTSRLQVVLCDVHSGVFYKTSLSPAFPIVFSRSFAIDCNGNKGR